MNNAPIADKISSLREINPEIRIGLCHGVFDVLHIGHIKHFKEAKSLCDILIVSITADKFVNKGPNRPLQKESDRKEILEALSDVDFVIVSDYQTSIEIISEVKPTIYFKGQEYSDLKNDITGNIKLEVEALTTVGGRIHFTGGVTNSSSSIINSFMLDKNDEAQKWINNNRVGLFDDLTTAINNIAKLKVVVIGELILDEYRFTQALGKVSKQPILAHREHSRKVLCGGSAAIARHVESFANETKLITLVGKDYEEKFSNLVNGSLGDIQLFALRDMSRPTVRKIRYIDQNSGAHVFEEYVMDDSFLDANVRNDLLDLVDREVKDCDLVLVCDFGHGMFDPEVTAYLNKLPSHKLCINVQANAGNGGKNTINKFPRRLMASLNGSELDLLLRQTGIEFKSIVNDYLKFEGSENLVVTHGSKGLAIRAGEEIIEVPALTSKVVDKVGAGDAVFAMSALFFGVNAALPANAFASSLAGAMSAKTFGNSIPISKNELLKAFKHLI